MSDQLMTTTDVVARLKSGMTIGVHIGIGVVPGGGQGSGCPCGDGAIDLAATLDRVPALLESGVTDLSFRLSALASNGGRASDLLPEFVRAFREHFGGKVAAGSVSGAATSTSYLQECMRSCAPSSTSTHKPWTHVTSTERRICSPRTASLPYRS
ncbi:hypothetical protein GCM10009836_24950 [Pseudonocardia ailaonensis]|uniref:Uncharacterized protein n=1 Tax=Pseudonocardia ailaonensis TaxID=367279 RepID=A0ABN2MYZ9_9PSEU